MPAIWTDENDRVTSVHYRPGDVDTSDAYIVDTIPEDASEPWESRHLYYTEEDGFTEVIEDPMEGFDLTDSEKQEFYRVVTRGDYEGTLELIEEYF